MHHTINFIDTVKYLQSKGYRSMNTEQERQALSEITACGAVWDYPRLLVLVSAHGQYKVIYGICPEGQDIELIYDNEG